jgi:hypothetical protein
VRTITEEELKAVLDSVLADREKAESEIDSELEKRIAIEQENADLKAEVERLEEWCYTLGSAPDGSDESIKVWFEFNAWRDQYYMNKATQGDRVRTITKEELKAVLDRHAKFLRCEEGGEKADLSYSSQWLGSQRLESQWLGSQWLGSQWLESQRLESQLLGSQWLGSQRLGSQLLESQWLGSQVLESQWLGSQRLVSQLLESQRSQPQRSRPHRSRPHRSQPHRSRPQRSQIRLSLQDGFWWVVYMYS